MTERTAKTITAKTIGVAIVEHADKVLVGVRGENVPLAGFAEFPGGKCEPGEGSDACAQRECLEESGLHVVPQECLLRELHHYDYGSVDLHFWRCVPRDPAEVTGRHGPYFWIPRNELQRWRFPEGNLKVIELLVQNPE